LAGSQTQNRKIRLSLKTGQFSNSKSQNPLEFENWPVLKLKIAESA
jgi:hypothetical protein